MCLEPLTEELVKDIHVREVREVQPNDDHASILNVRLHLLKHHAVLSRCQTFVGDQDRLGIVGFKISDRAVGRFRSFQVGTFVKTIDQRRVKSPGVRWKPF